MSRQQITRFLVTGVIVAAGLLLILYPFISNYSYEHRQEQVIFQYDEKLENTEDEEIKKIKEEAISYNENLAKSAVVLTDPFDVEKTKKLTKHYLEVLNPYGDGVMGYIDIPAISVYLPVFHTTEAKVLEEGIGHLENTSLPIGGKSTHAVLSGHTGLSDKRLFTDLEILEKGDVFYMHVLDETLAYQVDQIQVVEPQETQGLRIEEGKDYMTLVTCTPYGVNSHRLLVRGKRIPYEPEQEKEAAQSKGHRTSQWMRQYIYAVSAGVAILLVCMGIYRIIRHRREEHHE